MLSLIVAVSENNVIGKDNQLLWKLSADLKQFKTLTTNHVVIMGRKTFESIGKPLPNRISIIISRQENYSLPENCYVAKSLDEAINLAEKLKIHEEVFVIGGGEIYKQAMPKADKIYLTEVKTSIEGDTFFPKLNQKTWKEIKRISFQADEKNEYDFDFVELTLK